MNFSSLSFLEVYSIVLQWPCVTFCTYSCSKWVLWVILVIRCTWAWSWGPWCRRGSSNSQWVRGKGGVNCGVKSPRPYPCGYVPAPIGCKAVSTWGGSWSVPPSPRSQTHGSDMWVRLPASRAEAGPLIAFGSQCVLSGVPERPATLLGLLTWLFCFWVEGPSLILQSESRLHSTDTSAWMQKSNLGEWKALMLFDFSLTCLVRSLFTSRYGNQGHPSLIASVVTIPKSVRAQLSSEYLLLCGGKKGKQEMRGFSSIAWSGWWDRELHQRSDF